VQGGEAGGLHQANDAAASIAGAGVTDNSKGMQQAAQSGASTALVHSALPEVASVSKAQQIQSKVQPALEPAGKKAQAAAPLALMVQVATLAHQEDADVLVQALRRRGYAVGANRDPADGMVHVRVGPFASRDVANQWRQKLQNDGYNAVVESQ
jgi:cell division septation protein DedD